MPRRKVVYRTAALFTSIGDILRKLGALLRHYGPCYGRKEDKTTRRANIFYSEQNFIGRSGTGIVQCY